VDAFVDELISNAPKTGYLVLVSWDVFTSFSKCVFTDERTQWDYRFFSNAWMLIMHCHWILSEESNCRVIKAIHHSSSCHEILGASCK